jgi:hypothetical protein
MRRSLRALLPIAFACTACGYRERGNVALVMDPLESYEVVHQVPIQGTACFKGSAEFAADHVIAAALADALRKVPRATGIAGAQILDDGPCVHVRGVPVRLIAAPDGSDR